MNVSAIVWSRLGRFKSVIFEPVRDGTTLHYGGMPQHCRQECVHDTRLHHLDRQCEEHRTDDWRPEGRSSGPESYRENLHDVY